MTTIINDSNNYNWDELILNYESSGLSIPKWSELHKINKSKVYWQIKKRRRQSNPMIPGSCAPVFIPIQASTKESSAIKLSVGDVSITVMPGFDRLLLKEVIQVLASLC